MIRMSSGANECLLIRMTAVDQSNVVQHGLGFKMTYIQAKFRDKWLRYEQKHMEGRYLYNDCFGLYFSHYQGILLQYGSF